MKTFLFRILCGFMLGISVLAPGVSGSVIAILMGIYPKLLDIISNPFANLKRNILYLIPMGIGAALSALLFVLAFGYLFETYEKATILLFLGLMIGNLPVIFREIKRFRLAYLPGMVAAFLVALSVGVLHVVSTTLGLVSASKAGLFQVGAASAVGGMSSMIPGISVSMVLMALGVYETLLHAATALDLVTLMIGGGCFVLAMVAVSRFTKRMLERHHDVAYSLVLGLICGSIVSIILRLPPSDVNFTWPLGVCMFIAGVGISAAFIALGKRFRMEDEDAPPRERKLAGS